MRIQLSLTELPPSSNKIYYNRMAKSHGKAHGAGRGLTAAAQTFQNRALQAFAQQLTAQNYRPNPEAFYDVRILFAFPSAQERIDVDNRFKLLLDTLAKAMAINDSYFAHVAACKTPHTKSGLIIVISEIPPLIIYPTREYGLDLVNQAYRLFVHGDGPSCDDFAPYLSEVLSPLLDGKKVSYLSEVVDEEELPK